MSMQLTSAHVLAVNKQHECAWRFSKCMYVCTKFIHLCLCFRAGSKHMTVVFPYLRKNKRCSSTFEIQPSMSKSDNLILSDATLQ